MGSVRNSGCSGSAIFHFFTYLNTGEFRADSVRVIQQHPEVADAPHARMHARWRLPGFEPGIAQDALLGLAGLPVVVDLLVRTSRDAHPPTHTLFLAHQHDAILATLVDGARRTSRHAARIRAVIADAREVEVYDPLDVQQALPLFIAQ